jgi:uncharacterized transporter YbjL
MKDKKTNKQFNQGEKAKRGWWFSVFFMLLVVSLIIFLSFVKIVDENRDVLVGLIGMITGAVSSMLAIASGRDPSEVEELKDKLSSANADRTALIARLRDAQIQMQLLREQIFELQNAVIDKLSMFQNENPIITRMSSQVTLHKEVEDWLPKVNRDDDI